MKYSTMLNPGFSFFGIWEIKWYGVIMAFSMLMGICLAFYTCKKKGLNTDIIFDLAITILPLAIVGARLYFCIFYGVDSFWEIFEIWKGGMAIYGGVIGGVIGVFIVAKVKKISFIDLCDIAAPCLLLGQVIGRWGNFVNQEAYGYATDSLQFFPFSVYIDSCTQSVCDCGGNGWHLATFFYESFANAIGVIILLIITNKVKQRGVVTASYFAYYGLVRSIVEGLRTDSLMFLGLRVSQWLSILLIILGVAGLILIYIKNKNTQVLISDNVEAEKINESKTQLCDTKEETLIKENNNFENEADDFGQDPKDNKIDSNK